MKSRPPMVLDVAYGSAVKMVVSYGGEIVRCSDTGKARYAGGENRIVRVGMSERLNELRARLAKLAGYPDVRIQYAVAGPGGDGLDTLHDVADDHDLWVLVTRLCCCNGLASRDGRVRAFLFPVNAPPPPRRTPPARPASSPSLLESSKQGHGGVAAARATSFTLPRAQSAMALSTCTPASSMALSSDSGLEALAEIAAAQRSATGKGAASSSVASSSCAAASTGQADSGFDALAEIAAAQRSATGYTAHGAGASATCAAKADSGFEALATVAVAGQGQQGVQVFPPPATTVFSFLVLPVAPVAVFFHAIPVYGCVIPAVM